LLRPENGQTGGAMTLKVMIVDHVQERAEV